MKIDKTSFIPLYLQIEQQLTEKITAGAIKPGDPIPTEAALCEIYGVSRMTARKAVDYLVRQGRVERFRGRGTFVVRKTTLRKVNLPLDRHLTASELAVEINQPIENRVLEFKRISADAEIAAALGVPVGTALHFMVRLRLLGQEPFVYEQCWLLADMFPDLTRADLTTSKYAYLRSKGFEPVGSNKEISAELPSQQIRLALNLSRDEPVLHSRAVTEFSDGMKFEVSDVYYNQQHYSFSIRAEVKGKAARSIKGIAV